MILTCNSCAKKFVVPDNAITASGRMVQCGSCGNKWKQFPLEATKPQSISRPQKVDSRPQSFQQKIKKPKKIKKTIPKKPREISLYSPEYLAKKHGIKINDSQPVKNIGKKEKGKEKVSFGFYNYLILFIFLAIFLARMLYFAQEYIIEKLPVSEYYLNYFFESIRNIFEIWKNLVTNY